MIDVDVRVRRWFWQGVNPSAVEGYLKELNDAKAKLKEFGWEYKRLLFGGKLAEELIQAIDREIRYCEFYQEYNARVESEDDFDRWVFKTKDEIEAPSWRKPQGEQWTRTNGRIRATIQFDRSGVMVKLMLTYENDASLEFVDKYSLKPIVAHLRKESSINAKVSEMKEVADKFMEEHELPRYEGIMSELRDLRQLLCIGM